MFGHKTAMQNPGRFLTLLAFVLSLVQGQAQTSQSLTEKQREEIAFEALSRIEGDLNANPELKNSVYRLLTKVQGKPQFVQIVKKFQLKDQDPGLLAIAVQNPASENGVEGMRLILANDNTALIQKALQHSDPLQAAKAAEALGNTKERKAVPFLAPVLTNSTQNVVVRKMAVKSLAQTQEGAQMLLDLAKEDRLPADVKLIATTELNSVRWQKIKTDAEKILPPPQGQNAQPLPPISELAQLKGNAARGESVYFRELTMCAKCHRVKDRGGDIGPNLSEIGTKLGRDAMFEAIIDPSAGISLGYEGSSLELKSGDEAYGLVVSETENEIAVKDLNGIVTRYKSSDVAKRKVLKTSIMPAGLAATMTTQELVDLVEYLSTLKKAN